MIHSTSNNPLISSLAELVFAQKKHPQIGTEITNKVTEVLAHISSEKKRITANEKEVTLLREDVISITGKILEITGTKSLNTLVNSELWSHEERERGIPETLKQGLSTLINLLSKKVIHKSTHAIYYHGDILNSLDLTKLKGTIHDFVRSYTDTMLKEAYEEDPTPHYMLRDSTSKISPAKDREILTLSYIDKQGKVYHELLTWDHKSKKWLHGGRNIQSASLSKIIDHIAKGAKGVPISEFKANDFYSKYC